MDIDMIMPSPEACWGRVLPCIHDDIIERLHPGYYGKKRGEISDGADLVHLAEQDFLWSESHPPAFKVRNWTYHGKGGYLSIEGDEVQVVWDAYDDLMRKGIGFIVNTSEGRVTYFRLRWILDRCSYWPDAAEVRNLVDEFDLDPYVSTFQRAHLYATRQTPVISRDELRNAVANLLNLEWLILDFKEVSADGVEVKRADRDFWKVEYGRRSPIARRKRCKSNYRPRDIDLVVKQWQERLRRRGELL